MIPKRSLYQCFNAKVKGPEIRCIKGHALSGTSNSGKVNIGQLVKGKPLEMQVCQGCLDYDEMGSPLPQNERGWVTL